MPINLFANNLDEEYKQYQALTFCLLYPFLPWDLCKAVDDGFGQNLLTPGGGVQTLCHKYRGFTSTTFLALWSHHNKSRTVGPAIPSLWPLMFLI